VTKVGSKVGSKKFGQSTSEVAASSVYFKMFQQPLAETEGRRHERVCRNTHRPPGSNGCDITAHPEWGEVGSPWRPGHAQADALRYIEKIMLRDLYLISPN
jgi:hypothetical protein